MNTDRVIFFSKDDLVCGKMLSLAQPILDNFDNRQYDNIVDIIELYHIKQYIDANVRLDTWEDELFISYQNTIKQIWGFINRYIASIADENLENYLTCINREETRYSKSFWQLLDKCGRYKRINPKIFSKLFDITLWKEDILSCKNIVSHFDYQLRGLLLNYVSFAEMLILHYEGIGSGNQSNIYIPLSLTIEDKETIINNYINSDSPNINYLEVITVAREPSNFRLSPLTKLKAKKRYNEIVTEIFKKNTNATCFYKYGVSFSEIQTEPYNIVRENNELLYTYSVPYLQSDLSQIAIFKNFQQLFGFVDNQSRITLVRKLQDIGVCDLFGLHPQNEYLCPQTFKMKNELAHMQLFAYKYIIKHYFDICLEKVIEELFNTICSTHQIENLKVQFDVSINYLTQIRCIYPEIDSLLKRYKLYVDNGDIDLDLLAISSSSISIRDIPSLVGKKYAYINGEQMNNVISHLFSNQSLLYLVDGHLGKGYKSLVDLVYNEKVPFDSLEEYQKPIYQELVTLGYLALRDNIIYIANVQEIIVLKDLYNNKVISYWHIPEEYRIVIDSLADKGLVKFESTLFSTDEVDYFNYLLNKTFCNGLDLRNKYAHGYQGRNEEERKNDYYNFLLILILILWKIIDDLLVADKIYSATIPTEK